MKKTIIYKLLIVAIMFWISIFYWWKLPDIVPTHWGFDGQPNNWWSKYIVLVLLPLITLTMAILFPLLSKIDPKSENYKDFSKSWEIIQFSIIWMMAYFHSVILYVIAHPEVNISMFVMIWIWILFILLWNYMWKIKQNYFVWVKLPWTLNSDEVWNKTNRLSWKIFVIVWLILIINSFLQWYVYWVLIFLVIIISVVPTIYSYKIYKKW
jgi:uncharacterized membrane protein